jgi:hypothetical protein
MRLKLKGYTDDPYSHEVNHIVKIFADRGHEISYSDARLAWEKYSDSMCAGWLVLDSDDCYVFDNLIQYFYED